MIDIITVGIIGLILMISIRYIVKSKKAGVRCVGCSSAGTCASSCEENSLVKKFREEYGS